MSRQSVVGNFLTLLLVAAMIGALVCAASASVAGYTFTLDENGVQAHNPQAEAQATRIARAAMDESLAREVERQGAQAEADAATAAQPALVVRNVMVALGRGVGALVLLVGGAFVTLAWLGKRATAVYPNAAGQYPVIVRRGFGWITFHDPNRGLGPAAVYKVPTLLDQVGAVVAAIAERRALQLPAPAADFPATADSDTMARIATQAQAGQVAAAQNKWPKTPLWVGRLTSGSAREVSDEPPVVIEPAARMPVVRVVDDREQIERVERLLLSEGL